MTSTPRPYVANRIAQAQRLAREGTCPRCRARVLRGDDHDEVSFWTTVDAEPISPILEPRYVAAGLSTYDLDRGMLCYREPWHRVSEFPNPPPIHAWHVCKGASS